MPPLFSGFEAVIGLECHAQLRTRSKMFCRCPVSKDEPPNSTVCPVCLGHPGTLPAVNAEAVRLGVRAALALGAVVHPRSEFARKNYFYPDLPKGFQISQFDHPLATGGQIHTRVGGEELVFELVRLHLEEDAGRLQHEEGGSSVDLNRAGVPLVEIVGQADLHSPEQAEAWMRTLHRVLVESGVCTGDMEKGDLRCDANVSVHRPGTPWGTRVEVKNINSFRFVARALRFEIERQVRRIEEGGHVVAETRTWAAKHTVSLRKKEGSADYRYFREPDLPPLEVPEAWIREESSRLPGIPLAPFLLARDDAELETWSRESSLDLDTARVLRAVPEVAALFRGAVAAGGEPRAMAGWCQREVLRRWKDFEEGLGKLEPGHLRHLQDLVDQGEVTQPQARTLFETLWEQGGDPRAVAAALGLRRMGDETTLRHHVADVVRDSPAQVRKFQAGHRNMLGYFVGAVMKQTRGSADPRTVERIVLEILGNLGSVGP